MKENQPSSTALGVSLIRAVHQLIDDSPHILEDPISPLLLSKETIEAIQRSPERHRTLHARGLRSHVVLRSRYAEDQLREVRQQGLSHFISLGAGFDTFPFRQPIWANGLRIIEVDHPASQKAKLKHFARQGIPLAANTAMISVDLEKDDLVDCIRHASINMGEPIFVACLGVLAYLSITAVRAIFKSVASFAHGSILVLAFAPKNGTNERSSITSQLAETQGEPWLTYFSEEELVKDLAEAGFAKVDFLRPEEAAERYYRGRTDLPAPRKTRLCTCTV